MPNRTTIIPAVVLLWAGCTAQTPPPPTLTAVEPAVITRGEATTVVIRGRDFHPIARLSLVNQDVTTVDSHFELFLRLGAEWEALVDVRMVSFEELSAVVPATVPVGVYDLDLVDPRGRTANLEAALVVRRPGGARCVVDDDCVGDPCASSGSCASGYCAYDKDTDGDGYIDAACGGDDCDDDCGGCWPGNSETCDGIDNDCDAATPDGADETTLGDGCDGPDLDLCLEGSVVCDGASLVCDDVSDDTIEVVGDELDQDCDGEICFVDEDGDGSRTDLLVMSADSDCQDLGEAAAGAAMDCDDDPAGCGADCYVGNLDPDDCDGADNDCDGSVDEDEGLLWYHDADGDGFTNSVDTQTACVDPDGAGTAWVSTATTQDCADIPGSDPACNGLDGASCNPGLIGFDVCDGADNDCDGPADEDPDLTWYHDADGDSFTNNGDTQTVCLDPDGAGTAWVSAATTQDCADIPGADPACNGLDGASCNPGLIGFDLCDGADNDCDGPVDEDPDLTWYHDADGDNFTNNGDTQTVCLDPDGVGTAWVSAPTAQDCADIPGSDPACNGLDGALCNPGLIGFDLCDGADNDCDGPVDEDPEPVWYHDADGDNYTNSGDTQNACLDPDGAGTAWVSTATTQDCADIPGSDPACNGLDGALCNPGLIGFDLCDGADNDCDGPVDEDPEPVWYHDADGDSFTNNGDTQTACLDPDGAGTAWVSTATTQDCADIPGSDPACNGLDGALCNPGLIGFDLCDGADNDCDGPVDEDPEPVWYHDADGDNYTNSGDTQNACLDPDGAGTAWVSTATTQDCADIPGSDPACNGLDGALCNPGLIGFDLCDGADNDCDGPVDEDPEPVWYHDADGDNYTNSGDTQNACLDPDGAGMAWVSTATTQDCADIPGSDPACNGLDGALCNPGLIGFDLCDGADNDCDGPVDEDPEPVWYHDADGDNYTNSGDTQNACLDPDGAGTAWVSTATTQDCADIPGADPACNGLDGALCNPGLIGFDLCDGADNDCDGPADEDPDLTWYHDADGDSFTNNGDTQTVCLDPDGAGTAWVSTATTQDCADIPGADPACNGLDGALCNPGLIGFDVCDGADNDCDGPVDEDPEPVWYHDADGDGFTNSADTQTACVDPDGAGTAWVSTATTQDCADIPGADPACNGLDGALCNPGLIGFDLCDGADNDCDGPVDEDPDLTWYHDADGDSFTNNGDTQTVCLDPDGAGTAWVSTATTQDCADIPGADPACNGLDGGNCNPGLTGFDLCDGADNDCDGPVDEDPDLTWYHDADGDGFANASDTQIVCTDPDGPGSGWVGTAAPEDCDDLMAACGSSCSPATVESVGQGNCADGYDNDCDGLSDAGDPDCGVIPVDIFRSVGPGNTSPLAQGTSNSMILVGQVVAFANPVPDIIGVGDVIEYDADDDGVVETLAFIRGRNHGAAFVVSDVAGASPTPTLVADTDWAIFRAHTSLSDAEQGLENTGIAAGLRDFDTWVDGRDILANNEAWHIACYGDAVDTTAVVLLGWTTGDAHYLHVYTPTEPEEVGVSQRHPGSWDSSSYLISADGAVVTVTSPHVWIEGLRIETSGSHFLTAALQANLVGVSSYQANDNLITGPTATGPVWAGLGAVGNPSSVGRIYNNVVFDIGAGGDGIGVTFGTWFVYNNTVSSVGSDAFIMNVGATYVAKNNIARLATDNCFTGAFDPASDNNIADDATSTGGTSDQTGVTLTFNDPASGDFHLDVSDTEAIDAGLDLSADPDLAFSTDVDGESRGASWDIGADER